MLRRNNTFKFAQKIVGNSYVRRIIAKCANTAVFFAQTNHSSYKDNYILPYSEHNFKCFAYISIDCRKAVDIMNGIIQILLLLCALYGIASMLWELNECFFRQKNKNTVSYLAFMPLGNEDSIEFEIRSCIDYAEEMNCVPIILEGENWSDEKKKIASIIANESDIKIIHKKKV